MSEFSTYTCMVLTNEISINGSFTTREAWKKDPPPKWSTLSFSSRFQVVHRLFAAPSSAAAWSSKKVFRTTMSWRRCPKGLAVSPKHIKTPLSRFIPPKNMFLLGSLPRNLLWAPKCWVPNSLSFIIGFEGLLNKVPWGAQAHQSISPPRPPGSFPKKTSVTFTVSSMSEITSAEWAAGGVFFLGDSSWWV